MDENLPNPQDIATFEEESDDYYSTEGGEDIRGLMLKDPDLSEREIAAFFEGMRLVQVKVNSLQSQLDGLKAAQRMAVQQILMGSSSGSHGAAGPSSPRDLGRSATMIPRYQGGFTPRTGPVMSAAPSGATEGPSTTGTAPPPPPSSSGLAEYQPGPVSRKPPTSRKPIAADKNNSDIDAMSQREQPMHVKPTWDVSKSRSLRTMSIARIRTEVQAMDDAAGSGKNGGIVHRREDGATTTTAITKGADINAASSGGNSSNKEEIQRLLAELEEAEKYQKKLEKQLAQAGVVIAEDIPYDVAKEKVHSIALRMAEIGGSDISDSKLKEEYFRLEQEMEKYTTALQLTDEWSEEQAEMERQWEASIASANEEALRRVRRHMPVNVRNLSEAALYSQPTPNGMFLPKSIAQKFKRTNVLQLLRIDPEDIVPMHSTCI
jgi:hypothetical protein